MPLEILRFAKAILSKIAGYVGQSGTTAPRFRKPEIRHLHVSIPHSALPKFATSDNVKRTLKARYSAESKYSKSRHWLFGPEALDLVLPSPSRCCVPRLNQSLVGQAALSTFVLDKSQGSNVFTCVRGDPVEDDRLAALGTPCACPLGFRTASAVATVCLSFSIMHPFQFLEGRCLACVTIALRSRPIWVSIVDAGWGPHRAQKQLKQNLRQNDMRLKLH